MKKTEINGKPCLINESIEGFQFFQKSSSYVDFFGISNQVEEESQTGQIFFQFNNGKSFIFKDVPVQVLNGAVESDSIGKYYHAAIKNQYPADEIEERSIRPDDQEDDDDEDEGNTMYDLERDQDY